MQWMFFGKCNSVVTNKLTLRNATLVPRGIVNPRAHPPTIRRGDSVLCIEPPYMSTCTVLHVNQDTGDIEVHIEEQVMIKDHHHQHHHHL